MLELVRSLNPLITAVSAIVAAVSAGITIYTKWKEWRVRHILSGNEDELWHYRSPSPPKRHQRSLNETQTRIITVANLKGGVGKTTLLANLAAYFDRNLGKRVLVVDADYQGSISSLLLGAAGIEETASKTEALLAEGAQLSDLQCDALHIQPILPNTWLIPAFYSLSREENRQMIQWVMQGGTDVRYRMSEAFLRGGVLKERPEDNGFDVVLIDAPPRLTTATVNALCASTHLLVPTALTPISARAVGPFLKMAHSLKLELNQELKLAGVVGTLTNPEGSLGARERQLLDTTVEDALRQWNGASDAYIFNRTIPRRISMSTASAGTLGYIDNDNANVSIREILDEFGAELSQRIKLP